MPYKSDYNKYGAGTVLLWFSIKCMLENHSIKMIDFQKGKGKYMTQWGELNDYRYCYSTFNSHSSVARIEFYIYFKIISKLRILKKRIIKFRA